MVLAFRQKLKSTYLNIPNSFCFKNFAQKSIPGDVPAQVLQEPVSDCHSDLDLTQMVLAVRKKLKSTHLNFPNNFCFNNFAQKSIPGDDRVQILQVPVGASHPDQVRKSGMPNPFSDPGGQEESPGTPHLTLASLCRNPQGGSCCII